MIKKILNRFRKILLIGIGFFILLIVIGGIIIDWPTFFYDHDEWPKKMVEQCGSDFEKCVVSADSVTDFDWDKMYVFDDSAHHNEISEILGFAYDNPNNFTKRKIIFVKNNQMVHEELNFSNPFDGPPSGSAFFNYDEGNPPFYIARERNKAIFKITRSDESKDKVRFRITPIE